jgi:hypothetical protein
LERTALAKVPAAWTALAAAPSEWTLSSLFTSPEIREPSRALPVAGRQEALLSQLVPPEAR